MIEHIKERQQTSSGNCMFATGRFFISGHSWCDETPT